MDILDRLLPPSWSFRKQLLYTVSAGVACMALLASLATAVLQSMSMRDSLVQEGLQITDNFAMQSVLALLLSSQENAADSAKATLAFPNVSYVSIHNMERTLLLKQGGEVDWTPVSDMAKAVAESDKALLSQETGSFLHFVAPVYSRQQGGAGVESQFQLQDPQVEQLGFVHVAISKAELRKAQATIFINNIIVALIFAAVLLLLLRSIVNRATSPLQALAVAMRKAGEGEGDSRARIEGPAEVRTIAQVFNKMIAALEERDRQLREQNDNLEALVSSRTSELVVARDEALLASRHKSEFLANMSHELRTPLNAIIGYSEMVIEEMEIEGNDEVVTDLRRVHNAANHLLVMINTILDLAKIEAGRMDVWLEATDIRELVAEAVDTVRVLVRKNGNQLSVRVEGELDPVIIDGQKLRQILLNLLSNASKFTKDGHIEISVTITEALLVIVVSDSGIGMSEDQQAHIFEEFRQADMSTTREYGGTGLGLSITQRLCQLLGATIMVKSVRQQGSVFSVRIPLPVKGTLLAGGLPPRAVDGNHTGQA